MVRGVFRPSTLRLGRRQGFLGTLLDLLEMFLLPDLVLRLPMILPAVVLITIRDLPDALLLLTMVYGLFIVMLMDPTLLDVVRLVIAGTALGTRGTALSVKLTGLEERECIIGARGTVMALLKLRVERLLDETSCGCEMSRHGLLSTALVALLRCLVVP